MSTYLISSDRLIAGQLTLPYNHTPVCQTPCLKTSGLETCFCVFKSLLCLMNLQDVSILIRIHSHYNIFNSLDISKDPFVVKNFCSPGLYFVFQTFPK